MRNLRPLTFVVATNDKGVLRTNLLASGCLSRAHPHQVIIQEGYRSASQAYNDAIEKSKNDAIVFVHQDIVLPDEWMADLERSLQSLEKTDANWGVLGCWGATRNNWGVGYIYSTGLGLLGRPFDSPQPVETLDEIVLVIRKSSGLRFDERLPHFHLYGTDICLRAEAVGRTNYVVPAFCVHNTHQMLVLPSEFYECCRYIRRVWKHRLPVQTCCIRITRWGLGLHVRKLHETFLRYTGRDRRAAARADDIDRLLNRVNLLVQPEKHANLSV